MILALFLFMLLVPLFGGMWPMHKQAVNKNRAALGANHICRQILERAITAGFNNVDDLETVPLADRTITLKTTREDKSGGSSEVSKDFVWTVEVKNSSEEPSLLAKEKLVEVEVAWMEKGEPKLVTMSTLLADS